MNAKMDFSPHTDVHDHGQIKSIRIPAGWKDGPCEQGGAGFRSLKTFLAPQDPEVSISFFYRGFALSPEASTAFREIIKHGPRTIFIARTGTEPSSHEKSLFSTLREVLGNAGNNQVVNRKTDWRGPSFHVDQVEVLAIGRRNVLSVKGWFRNPEENQRGKEFAGLFIDTNPENRECGIQEIFMEAPDAERFTRFAQEFGQAISSIVWR